ncbi:hypothetical protein ZWY2020_052071 [Hordeum vulgare]|nr:hypothetical protein ZWY2020_052071 [Hordeum vulgare]
MSEMPQPLTENDGEQRCLNSELWHACAGPLVSLPAVGSRVIYFPQGHSEQVAASTNKEVDAQIPNYPNLPPQLICQLHNADVETDEVYAQMTLQLLSPQKEPFLPIELGAASKQPTNYFCKTLSASDTSTHGGFSLPRCSAEEVFRPLDFSLQPPCQELIAKDLHDNEWKFRYIFCAAASGDEPDGLANLTHLADKFSIPRQCDIMRIGKQTLCLLGDCACWRQAMDLLENNIKVCLVLI